MRTSIIKHSIMISGHKTSVSLEDAFWTSLKTIAARRGLNISGLISEIDSERSHGNLSSAIRLFILDHYRSQFAGHRAESVRELDVRPPSSP